eukprot:jgi/Chlat1/5685/Chrsp374S05466
MVKTAATKPQLTAVRPLLLVAWRAAWYSTQRAPGHAAGLAWSCWPGSDQASMTKAKGCAGARPWLLALPPLPWHRPGHDE